MCQDVGPVKHSNGGVDDDDSDHDGVQHGSSGPSSSSSSRSLAQVQSLHSSFVQLNYFLVLMILRGSAQDMLSTEENTFLCDVP